MLKCGAGEDEVFLDPFGGGRILAREHCLSFLEQAGFGADAGYLAVTDDRFVLARMIMNLVQNFRRKNDAERAERYRKLFEKVRGEPME